MLAPSAFHFWKGLDFRSQWRPAVRRSASPDRGTWPEDAGGMQGPHESLTGLKGSPDSCNTLLRLPCADAPRAGLLKSVPAAFGVRPAGSAPRLTVAAAAAVGRITWGDGKPPGTEIKTSCLSNWD